MDTRSIKIVHLKNPVSIIDIERFSERFGIVSVEDVDTCDEITFYKYMVFVESETRNW